MSILTDILCENLPSQQRISIHTQSPETIKNLIYHGHNVHAHFSAASSYRLTALANDMSEYIDLGRLHMIVGDFQTLCLMKEKFNVVATEQSEHLKQGNSTARTYASRAAHILDKDGLVYASALSTHGIDPNLITRSQDKLFANINGEEIDVWDEERFNNVFGNKFNVLSLQECLPPSSDSSQENRLIIMRARKKDEPGCTQF